MLKPYKEEDPLVTINKIRSILTDLGIFVVERHIHNGDYYTCRIDIANEDLLEFEIGTNGKGTSLAYAYASAYAEFMERLQNNILIPQTFYFSKYHDIECIFNDKLNIDNKQLEFLYCPTEKLIEIQILISDNYELFRKLFFIDDEKELVNFITNELKYDKILCAPFYNHKSNKINYLPIDLLFQCTYSTGMCAGNTPEEALIQGISEILERYAIKEIYTHHMTPPTIPHEYFQEYSVYELIQNLTNKGFELIIKDFSLGKNIPVIAVILIDKKSKKYNIKVGSDPWPVTALERCLTEIHQSFNCIRLIDKYDYGYDIRKDYDSLSQSKVEYINLSKIYNDATGQWGDYMFNDEYSYEFKNLNFGLGKSNKLDLEYLIQLIYNLDSELFIRDVSYLGFNSYYIILPGLSQDKKSKDEYTFFHRLKSQIGAISNISSLTNCELSSLVSIIEEDYVVLKDGYIDFSKLFSCNIDSDVTELTIDLFLSMANYKLGNIDKAYSYMDNYLADKDVVSYIYFYACKDYLSLLNNKKNKHEIESYMTKIYGKDLKDEIIEDISDNNDIFKSYNLQSYFYSTNCDITNFKYYNVSSILINIQNKHKINIIDQMNLSNIFY